MPYASMPAIHALLRGFVFPLLVIWHALSCTLGLVGGFAAIHTLLRGLVFPPLVIWHALSGTLGPVGGFAKLIPKAVMEAYACPGAQLLAHGFRCRGGWNQIQVAPGCLLAGSTPPPAVKLLCTVLWPLLSLIQICLWATNSILMISSLMLREDAGAQLQTAGPCLEREELSDESVWFHFTRAKISSWEWAKRLIAQIALFDELFLTNMYHHHMEVLNAVMHPVHAFVLRLVEHIIQRPSYGPYKWVPNCCVWVESRILGCKIGQQGTL